VKNLTVEQKASIIDKWQAIIRNIIATEDLDYFKCDLYKVVNRIRIRQEDGDCRIHVSMALDLAAKGRFKRALTHAETVLAAILATEVED
jgi:hypothetical protein